MAKGRDLVSGSCAFTHSTERSYTVRHDINICPSLMGLNRQFYLAMARHCSNLRGPHSADPGNHWFSDLTFCFIGM